MFGSRKDFGAPATNGTAVSNSGNVLGASTNPASAGSQGVANTPAPDSSAAANPPSAATPPDSAAGAGSGAIETDAKGNLYEQTGSISLHPSADESSFTDLLKNIMPYITGLFYVTTMIAVIYNRINKNKNKQKGFGNALVLFLAISAIFSTLVYLILT
jgi:hypothetical protein